LKLKGKKKKKGKREKGGKGIFYRIQGKKKRVRCIHGVLLVRDGGKGGEWIELVPYLRKLAGLPQLDQEASIKTFLKKSRKGKK